MASTVLKLLYCIYFVWGDACEWQHVWRSGNKLQESILSFHHMGLQDQNQDIVPDDRCWDVLPETEPCWWPNLMFQSTQNKARQNKTNKQNPSFPIYLESALSNHEYTLSHLDIVYKLKPFIHVLLRYAPFMSCMDFGIHDSRPVIWWYNNPLCVSHFLYTFISSPSLLLPGDVSLCVNTGFPFSWGILLW